MKQTIMATALTVLIVLGGTAIAFKVGAMEKRGAYNDFAFAPETQIAPGGIGCRSGRGGCGSGGCALSGGTGGCRNSAPQDGQGVDLEPIKKAAAEYYINKYGDADITADARDFGCHQEAYILKDGYMILKLAVSGNQVYEAY